MKKTIITILHLGYWLLYSLLLALILSIVSLQTRVTTLFSLAVLPIIVLSIVPNVFSFYASYFILFTRFLKEKKITLLVIFGIIICLVAASGAILFSIFIFGFSQPVFSDFREFLPLFLSFFFIAAVHSGMALVIRGFITWFDEIKVKEELAQKNYETEIALIKSQINPHFLFNTINNIDVLITKDSAKASAYLNKLSDILRYMVYDTKSEKISLAKELDYINKYLELQKIRTTNPHYVKLEIEGTPKNTQIAPMIFFPYIENAFKHTENNKNHNSINIKFSLTEKRINFECCNTFQKTTPTEQLYGGLGNQLIRKRLHLLYPERHTLEIKSDDGIYQVKLMIYED